MALTRGRQRYIEDFPAVTLAQLKKMAERDQGSTCTFVKADFIQVRVEDDPRGSARALLLTKDAPQAVIGDLPGPRQRLPDNGAHGIFGPRGPRREGKTA